VKAVQTLTHRWQSLIITPYILYNVLAYLRFKASLITCQNFLTDH